MIWNVVILNIIIRLYHHADMDNEINHNKEIIKVFEKTFTIKLFYTCIKAVVSYI